MWPKIRFWRRIAATAPLGPVSGMIAADSTGATEQDITVSGTLTVNPEDVSGQVSTTRSGLVLNRSTQLFGGTITLTNTGSTALTGTLEVLLTGLPSGVTLANASGTVNGNPYILVNLTNGVLASGQSINFTVLFANPHRLSFLYEVSIYDV